MWFLITVDCKGGNGGPDALNTWIGSCLIEDRTAACDPDI